MGFNWVSCFRITLLFVLIGAIAVAFLTLPVDKMLQNFLLFVHRDLGRWGPLALSKWMVSVLFAVVGVVGEIATGVQLTAIAYIPLTVLAVPASILTLGGGYLFGLPVGFVADSVGATLGATAAFLIGRTIGRSYVTSKLKDYPKFQAIGIATNRSGFKIVLLLRLVPLLPFNMLNYLLSVTAVPLGEYMLATWLGMLPITLALVYVGTTLKDISDISHGWHEVSKTRWAMIVLGLVLSVGLLVWVTRIAKAALDKALTENEDLDTLVPSSDLPMVADPMTDLQQPFVIRIDPSQEDHEK